MYWSQLNPKTREGNLVTNHVMIQDEGITYIFCVVTRYRKGNPSSIISRLIVRSLLMYKSYEWWSYMHYICIWSPTNPKTREGNLVRVVMIQDEGITYIFCVVTRYRKGNRSSIISKNPRAGMLVVSCVLIACTRCIGWIYVWVSLCGIYTSTPFAISYDIHSN